MGRPSLSVALATFNGEAFVTEQLASLARQTVPPAELVVVDDASTDGTVSLVREFATTAPFPVRLEQNLATLGWGENFMRALSLCTSDVVAPCDQDDVWVPHKLERCTDWFEQRPDVSLVGHACRLVDERLRPSWPPRREPPIYRTRVLDSDSLPMGYAQHGMSLVFRRDLLAWCPPEVRPLAIDRIGQTPMNHDSFVCFLAPLAGPVVLLAEELVAYRRHGRNASQLRTPLGGSAGARGFADITAKTAGYRRIGLRCREAAAFLEAVSPPAGVDDLAAVRARADRRAALHRRAASAFEQRAAVFDAGSRGRQAAAVAHLAASGGYRRRGRGGLGLSSLALDSVLALLMNGRRSDDLDDQTDAEGRHG